MATAQRDYYEVLGVSKEADEKAIKDAFRKLALEFHPDRNKAPGAEERFKEIAEAYAVLSDPKKRAEYDSRGFAGVAGFSSEDLFGGIDFGDIFGGLGFDFGGGGVFNRFFGRHRRRGSSRQGANVEVALEVPLSRVLSGGEETVRLARPQPCAACHGTGAEHGAAPRTCAECNGKGQRVVSRREGNVSVQQITTCQVCRGKGAIIEKPCKDCNGRGEVEREETLTVKIPVGVEEEVALRIPGHGLPSREAGGVPGDLYVVVHSAPDCRFERRGANLWLAETISIPDAVLGTRMEIPTLDGTAAVAVAAGTQPNAVLRLRGKGLPEFGGNKRGEYSLPAAGQALPDGLSSRRVPMNGFRAACCISSSLPKLSWRNR